MSKEYWLFARPIFLNSGSRKEVKYYDYYRYNNESELIYGYQSDYAGNDRPCLILKNLFADLFSGNTVYYDSPSGIKIPTITLPRLIDSTDSTAKSILYFFPFFTKRKEYESRFRQRKKSSMNPYANILYSGLKSSPDEYIEKIERACVKFFKEDCTLLNADRLNTYLVSRIEIFIDYIIDNDKFSRVEKSNAELKNSSIQTMRLSLDSMSGNLPVLLSRLLILAGLDWDKIDGLVLEQLLIGGRIRSTDYECDRFYTAYCEENKTDFSKLRGAYERLCPSAKYYKEIICDYADSLMHFDSEEKQNLAFKILTRLCEKHTDCGRAISLLAFCNNSGIGCVGSKEIARELYEKAAQLDDGSALLALAEEAFGLPLPEQKLMAVGYCKRILKLSPPINKELLGRAAFIIAEVYLTVKKDKVSAWDYYSISAEASYAHAKQRLRLLSRPNRPSPAEVEQATTEEYCEKHIIVSGCEDVVESIRSRLRPSEWQMRLLSENTRDRTNIRGLINEYLDGEYADDMRAEEYPARSVFVFAESDEDVNLRNTLYLLDRLYSKYCDIIISTDDEREKKAECLMRSFDVYLSAEYETASIMIDASLAEMEDGVHFKIHICDTNKDLAEQLIYRAPLFIPTVRGEGEPNVVAFGSSDFIYSFIREVTASCYMINHPVKISAIGSNVSNIEYKFKQNCGGIYTARLTRKIAPQFFDFDTARPDLDDIISGRPISNDPISNDIKRVIAAGNYFVVDVGSDMENILFAKNLRAWLLRSDSRFKRMPFIAVRCRDSVNAFWISRLHSGGKRQDPHWYNDYDFYIFGMMSDIYPSVITDGLIERIALGVHFSYDTSRGDKEIAHFWQSTYRQDSSRATAVGLVYRMFDCGVSLSNYRDYHNVSFKQMAALAEEYDERIRDNPKLIDRLAAAEQARWSCFMLSRGWLTATAEQVRAYTAIDGNTSHRHDLAKLHPYICDWEDIDDGDDSHRGKALTRSSEASSPRDITIKSITDTRKFFIDPRTPPEVEAVTKNK